MKTVRFGSNFNKIFFIFQATPITQYLKASSSYQGNVCGALRKFGPKVLNSM